MTGASIRALARALGGEVVGADRILGPGPGHSRKDRSLSVMLGPQFPDGFWVTSFAGDDELVCRDYVRDKAGLSAWPGNSSPEPAPPLRVIPLQDKEAEKRAAWVRAHATALWDEAVNPLGTVVHDYLASRALDLPSEVAGSALRYHTACPWKEESGALVRVPAMLAALRCIHTDRLVGLHRTRLTSDGRKVDRRMLGSATSAAIKIDADETVTHGLVIGEGVETVLAAREIGFKPAWALGSAGGIAVFPVLPGIGALNLLAEDDTTGANTRAVKACAMRWIKADREVFRIASRDGGDMNDALLRRAG